VIFPSAGACWARLEAKCTVWSAPRRAYTVSAPAGNSRLGRPLSRTVTVMVLEAAVVPLPLLPHSSVMLAVPAFSGVSAALTVWLRVRSVPPPSAALSCTTSGSLTVQRTSAPAAS